MGRVILDGEAVRRRRAGLPGAPSQIELAARAKISRVTLSDIERGRAGGSYAMAQKLARALGCQPGDIIVTTDAGGASVVRENSNLEPRRNTRLEPVPVRGMVSASGVDYQPDEPPRGFTPFVIEWPMRGHLDALRVSGKSMEPTVRDGEYVIVRRDGHADVRDGSLAVVRVDGQLFLKRIYRDGDIIILKCDNPKHKERRYSATHVEILGVAIMAQEEPRRL